MIHPKLEKLLFGIFDDAIQGVDRYTHNGSLWLIFTDEMRWIVEYTKHQKLWYNYYFFEKKMLLCNLNCVDNKDLIQKWFESRFLNINPVEDTIQNGVKQTLYLHKQSYLLVEDTIQNGVKHTSAKIWPIAYKVEDTIQNGVKQILDDDIVDYKTIEDIIQNGTK